MATVASKKCRKPKRSKPSPIILARAEWPEAEIIDDVLPTKRVGEPRLIVRRRQPVILGTREEQLISLPGEPWISLFTGAGGMDLGLEQAGATCLVQHEMVEEACSTLLINRPRCFRHAALIQGNICQTSTWELLDAAGLRVGEAFGVCGGPPCQGFSTANPKAGRGEYDPRNDLVFEYLRVVREAQPKFFIMENVPGILSLNKGQYVGWFLAEAYKAGYEIVYGLLDAVEYGVPQHRCRFIAMGTRRDLWHCEGVLASLPKPFCFSDPDLAIVRDLEGRPLFADELAILTHAPGIRYFPDRKLLIPPKPIRQNGPSEEHARSKSFQEFYAKLRREEPDRIVEGPQGGD